LPSLRIHPGRSTWLSSIIVTGDHADLQAQFSLAYVQAVASVAGYFVQISERGFDKDGIDATLMRRGKLGVTASPRLDLQVKSHHGRATGDPWPYDLDVKAYDDLRKEGYQVPRILVVVLVPDGPGKWLSHSEDELVLRRCGYWLDLHGAAATTNTSKIRVQIPRSQVFDVGALDALMARIRRGAP